MLSYRGYKHDNLEIPAVGRRECRLSLAHYEEIGHVGGGVYIKTKHISASSYLICAVCIQV